MGHLPSCSKWEAAFRDNVNSWVWSTPVSLLHSEFLWKLVANTERIKLAGFHAQGSTSSHTKWVPEAIKIVFAWLNLDPFELCGGSFPLALSCNCAKKNFFFWSDLESKEPSSQPTPPPSSYPESIKICSCCNICYIPYPEAKTGRTKLSSHTHTCMHTHAHKDTGWVDWKAETNQNKV